MPSDGLRKPPWNWKALSISASGTRTPSTSHVTYRECRHLRQRSLSWLLAEVQVPVRKASISASHDSSSKHPWASKWVNAMRWARPQEHQVSGLSISRPSGLLEWRRWMMDAQGPRWPGQIPRQPPATATEACTEKKASLSAAMANCCKLPLEIAPTRDKPASARRARTQFLRCARLARSSRPSCAPRATSMLSRATGEQAEKITASNAGSTSCSINGSPRRYKCLVSSVVLSGSHVPANSHKGSASQAVDNGLWSFDNKLAVLLPMGCWPSAACPITLNRRTLVDA
mmetsp:Transcript_97739/g.276476  ORF Transcript_97739/g.276476 Transcript_97739/m.276476 type:complete len:287 (+) Transcript_97739:1024-1884(+)